MLTREQCEQRAMNIPALGVGGITIHDELVSYASNVPKDQAIIELGPWLGSATAYLSIGSMFGKGATIHTYDMWVASETYISRAKRRHNLSLKLNEDIQPYFMDNMKGFSNFVPHKMSIFDIEWNGPYVGMLVIDMGNGKAHTDCAIDKFKDYFIPGETVIFMMDYFFAEARRGQAFHYQKHLYEANRKVLKFLDHPIRSKTAIFRYMGGEIKYVDGYSYPKDLNEGTHAQVKTSQTV